MNTVVLILRFVHVLAGVFWVGAALVNSFFLVPTVAATAEAGQKFMAHLVNNARLSARLTVASGLTVLAGAILYWIDSAGFTSGWWTSGAGVGFGIGGLAGLIGMIFGHMVGRNASRIGQMAAQIKGAPSAEQAAELQRARMQMSRAGNISTGFLIASLICMATARYWLF